MTDKQLLQKALDYLKDQRDYSNDFNASGYFLIEVLEDRLADPDTEPLGEVIEVGGTLGCFSTSAHGMKSFKVGDLIYTHPQPERKPLSEDTLWEMWRSMLSSEDGNLIDFARAIERQHGIK